MAVSGLRQVQQVLKHAVDACCCIKILAAQHIRDSLARVIDDNGEVIAGRRVFPGQNYIAPGSGINGDGFRWFEQRRTFRPILLPGERFSDPAQSRLHIKPEGKGRIALRPLLYFLFA